MDTETAPRSTSPPAPAWWRRPAVAWAVAAVAVVVAVVAVVRWQALAHVEDRRADVRATAEEFLATLTNWDATDGLEDTREALRTAGTGAFVDEVEELFGGTLGAELEAAGVVSTGEVDDVFVQRLDGDEAVVFGVVVQELRAEQAERSDRTVRSARLTLQREEDRWLVSSVQLLDDDPGDDPGDDATPPQAPAGTPPTEETTP